MRAQGSRWPDEVEGGARSFLDELVETARRMTPQERFETLVRAGVFTPDGKLTERFRSLGEDGDEPTSGSDE